MAIKLKKRLIALGVSNQGFTIIELLVVMVLSLVVLDLIYATVRSQSRSYMVQEDVAVMQQNIRAGMFSMVREIQLAGCNPTTLATAGITQANATTIRFTEDVTGDTAGSAPDGAVDDPNEDITYTTASNNLTRNGQIAAENIEALDFVYLDGASPPVVLNPNRTNVSPANLASIRAVEVTMVARTANSLRSSPNNNAYVNQQDYEILPASGENVSRKRLTTFVKCRNLDF
jgi:type IV pilus assembly protein PilW